MKNYLLIIVTIFAITQGICSQTEKRMKQKTDLISVEADTSQIIANIEKTTQEIKNNISKYQKTEKVKDSISNKYVYKNGSELKLLTMCSKEEFIIKDVEWYFSNEHLIYSLQISTDREFNRIIASEKFYFNNKHLIAWTKDGRLVDSHSSEFKKVDTDLPAYGTELISQTK